MATKRKRFKPVKFIECYYKKTNKFGKPNECILCSDCISVPKDFYYLALEEHLKSAHPSEYEIFYTELEVLKKTQDLEFLFGELPDKFMTEVRKHFKLVKTSTGIYSVKCQRCSRRIASASNKNLLPHLRNCHRDVHARLVERPNVLSSFDALSEQRILSIDGPCSEALLARISSQHLVSHSPSTIQEHFILTNQPNRYKCRHCTLELNNISWSSPACISGMRDHLMSKHKEITRKFFDRSPTLHLSSLYSDVDPEEVYKKHYSIDTPKDLSYHISPFTRSFVRCQLCHFRISIATAKPSALKDHLAARHTTVYLDFMREYKMAQFELIKFTASTKEEIFNYFTPKFCNKDIVICYLCLVLVPCEYLDSLWDHMYECHKHVYNLLSNYSPNTTLNSVDSLPSRIIYKYFLKDNNMWICKKCSFNTSNNSNNLSLREHLVAKHKDIFLEFSVDYRYSMKKLLTKYNAPITEETVNDYYKIIINSDTFAKCEICYVEFNFRYTFIDLLIHLKVIHNNGSTCYTDQEKENNEFFKIPEVQKPLTTNRIWKYFESSHDSDVASCKECKAVLSKDIFFMDMRHHLELKHTSQFISFLGDCELDETPNEIKEIEKNQEETSNTFDKQLKIVINNEPLTISDVKKYFRETKENKDAVSCKHCSRCFPLLSDNLMKDHLLLDHGDLYAVMVPEKVNLENNDLEQNNIHISNKRVSSDEKSKRKNKKKSKLDCQMQSDARDRKNICDRRSTASELKQIHENVKQYRSASDLKRSKLAPKLQGESCELKQISTKLTKPIPDASSSDSKMVSSVSDNELTSRKNNFPSTSSENLVPSHTVEATSAVPLPKITTLCSDISNSASGVITTSLSQNVMKSILPRMQPIEINNTIVVPASVNPRVNTHTVVNKKIRVSKKVKVNKKERVNKKARVNKKTLEQSVTVTNYNNPLIYAQQNILNSDTYLVNVSDNTVILDSVTSSNTRQKEFILTQQPYLNGIASNVIEVHFADTPGTSKKAVDHVPEYLKRLPKIAPKPSSQSSDK